MASSKREPRRTFSVSLPKDAYDELMDCIRLAKLLTASDKTTAALQAILAEFKSSLAYYQGAVAELRYRQVYERQGWRCSRCQRMRPLHAHHIVRRSQGGGDEPENLVALCAECHRKEHDGLSRG